MVGDTVIADVIGPKEIGMKVILIYEDDSKKDRHHLADAVIQNIGGTTQRTQAHLEPYSSGYNRLKLVQELWNIRANIQVIENSRIHQFHKTHKSRGHNQHEIIIIPKDPSK